MKWNWLRKWIGLPFEPNNGAILRGQAYTAACALHTGDVIIGEFRGGVFRTKEMGGEWEIIGVINDQGDLVEKGTDTGRRGLPQFGRVQ